MIDDAIRGDVRFNTSAVGDFVVMRSNGLPVYNFCVAVDDALMRISHVIRAEEHLPNTLRQVAPARRGPPFLRARGRALTRRGAAAGAQVLIYNAFGWSTPTFAHVSLILAPDKSKLSKRHGATSVSEFRAQGFLPGAMVNYLSLLGWNDGTEQARPRASTAQACFLQVFWRACELVSSTYTSARAARLRSCCCSLRRRYTRWRTCRTSSRWTG